MAKENVYKWSFIERITLAVVNFGGNIVLARMLSTDDFGLLAMVAIIIATSYNLSSCGLSDGLIHKLKPTSEDYSTVFVFNSALGLLFGITSIALAGTIARFFGHEELVWVMRMYGICFFFQTMSFVQETRLRKQLEMKKLCIARVAATVTALALGIVLAALGCGYWALISTQIFLSFFMFVYIVAVSRWFPKIAFNVKSFKEFFGYGIHLMITYIINVVEQNVNTFVLGRGYTPAMTGIYSQGAKLANVPFSVVESSLNAPFFAVASNESDPETRRKLILEMMSTIFAVTTSIALLILLIARPAVELLYGERWLASAPVLQVMGLFGCAMCVKYFGQTIFKVYGRTLAIRNLTLCECLIQLTLLALFWRHGLIVMAITQLAACVLAVCVYLAISSRILKLTFKELWKSTIGNTLWPVTGFVTAGAAKWLLKHQDVSAPVEFLCVGAAFGAVLIAGLEINRPQAYLKLRGKIFRKNS